MRVETVLILAKQQVKMGSKTLTHPPPRRKPFQVLGVIFSGFNAFRMRPLKRQFYSLSNLKGCQIDWNTIVMLELPIKLYHIKQYFKNKETEWTRTNLLTIGKDSKGTVIKEDCGDVEQKEYIVEIQQRNKNIYYNYKVIEKFPSHFKHSCSSQG